MMLDYETLRVIWWALLGILLIGFAVTDGYDLGAGMLLPFAARSDAERRQMLESIEPHWEGHQVWLITGAGVSFAARMAATGYGSFCWMSSMTMRRSPWRVICTVSPGRLIRSCTRAATPTRPMKRCESIGSS